MKTHFINSLSLTTGRIYILMLLSVSWAGCGLFLPSLAYAQLGGNQLQQIGYSTLPGNRVQVVLTFSGKPSRPVSFSTENPARIVLDFPATALAVSKRSENIGVGAVQSVGAVEANERTRVVLNLVRIVPFKVDVSDNRVLIAIENFAAVPTLPPTVGNANVRAALAVNSGASAQPMPAGVSALSSSVLASEPAIENIDFRRVQDAEGGISGGKVIVTLNNPEANVSLLEQGEDIIVTFSNLRLPEKYNRRLDVVDFATPVQFIDTTAEGNNVKMRITAKSFEKPSAYQTGSTYIVEIYKKIEKSRDEIDIKDREYRGTPVSFNFQGIPVQSALQILLIDVAGKNLVTSDAVKSLGQIGLRLKNVPWDQALDIILESQGLGMREAGNVIMIDTKSNLDAREKRELEARKELKELEPLRTEYIQINYSTAMDIRDLLQSKAGEERGHSFLTPGRGSVSVDERTNKLIVRDTSAQLTEIRRLVAALDTPVRQVLIESRVVIASEDFGRSLGVKFGYSGNQDLGNQYGMVLGGKAPGDTQFRADTAFTSNNTQVAGGSGENYIVNLPAALASAPGVSPAAVGLAIGKIGSYLLQLELSALQTEGRGEVISSPRVITADRNKAKILQGREISVPGVAGVGAVAAPTFKEAVLSLEVTPQITPDDRIIMDLTVKKDEPIGLTTNLNRREVDTEVLVDNGETVVLGGVYEQTQANEIRRVPFLSDLPLVGELFKSRSKSDTKSELLIFVTPKILKENS